MKHESKEFHAIVRVWNEFRRTFLCKNHRHAIPSFLDDRLHRSGVVFFASVVDIVAQNVVLVIFHHMIR